jgi:hypothetical protein
MVGAYQVAIFSRSVKSFDGEHSPIMLKLNGTRLPGEQSFPEPNESFDGEYESCSLRT